jgi:hypothetical protein
MRGASGGDTHAGRAPPSIGRPVLDRFPTDRKIPRKSLCPPCVILGVLRRAAAGIRAGRVAETLREVGLITANAGTSLATGNLRYRVSPGARKKSVNACECGDENEERVCPIVTPAQLRRYVGG